MSPKLFFPSGAVKILQAFLVYNMCATCFTYHKISGLYRQCLLQDKLYEHTQDAPCCRYDQHTLSFTKHTKPLITLTASGSGYWPIMTSISVDKFRQLVTHKSSNVLYSRFLFPPLPLLRHLSPQTHFWLNLRIRFSNALLVISDSSSAWWNDG